MMMTRRWKEVILLIFLHSIGQSHGQIESLVIQLIERMQEDLDSTRLEVTQLGHSIEDHHNQIDKLKSELQKKDEEIFFLKELTKVLSPRSCDELKSFGIFVNGYYWIDLDGPRSGQPPVSVFCDFSLEPLEIGHTFAIGHNMEEMTTIQNCGEFCYHNSSLVYDISIEQVKQVIDQSTNCSQSIEFHCNQAPIQMDGDFLVSWQDLQGEIHHFFNGDGSQGNPMCACGFYETCAKSMLGVSEECNCNALVPKWMSDTGVIDKKDILPIMGFYYGPLKPSFGQAKFTIGKLKCTTQSSKFSASVDSVITKIQDMQSTFEDFKTSTDVKLKLVKPKDCYDNYRIGNKEPGIYTIAPNGITQVEVFCKDDGWTVIQSRGKFGNTPDYFYKNWAQYQKGFGEPGEEQWIGLQHIFSLTNQTPKKAELRIILENFSNETKEAHYETFFLENEQTYNLFIDGYSGSAGDSLLKGFHHGRPFATFNQGSSSECASISKGGWWYFEPGPSGCHISNLNGWNFAASKVDCTGINWATFSPNGNMCETLKSVHMLIKPKF